MEQSVYKTSGVLYQLSLYIYSYGSVTKALQSDWNPEDLDKIVAMIGNRGEMLELNTSAACIWEALDEQHTIPMLTKRVFEVFDIDIESARRVVEDVIQEFQHLGLIQLTR